jgi:hypothetical protein
MDNAIRKMFSMSKEDLLKAEAKWKRAQARKKQAKKTWLFYETQTVHPEGSKSY